MDALVALLGLAVVHLLGAASPGPSTVLVVQTAATSGRRGGRIAALGMSLGATAWAAATLFGLQALFAHFAWLHLFFQVAGGLYLIYLAVMIWRHARDPLPEMTAIVRGSDWQNFTRALLLQLSNPKIMVFFGSVFLSVLPHDMPVWMQGTVLAIVAIDEFLWYSVLTQLFSGNAARAFYRRAKFWIERFMGGALALLGLRLALSAR
jgi:RhtB (resistance to homoserine/threonine) family protein